MTVAGGLAVYFVIWWVVLFVVLPFGISSQSEDGAVTAGTEPGAPTVPGLAKKALITTVIAAAVFALVWYIWATFDL